MLVYLTYVQLAGFPDGHLSELEEAERTFAYVFVAVSAGFSAAFAAIASAKQARQRWLWLIGGFYAAAVLLSWLLDQHYRAVLLGGEGG